MPPNQPRSRWVKRAASSAEHGKMLRPDFKIQTLSVGGPPKAAQTKRLRSRPWSPCLTATLTVPRVAASRLAMNTTMARSRTSPARGHPVATLAARQMSASRWVIKTNTAYSRSNLVPWNPAATWSALQATASR